MSLDIKTVGTEPKRQTYANVARRLGGDRPASRYLEATYDMQAEINFHYRPTCDSRFEIFDKRRTRIVMEDWYKPLDPRQFYYGAYTMARARMIETFEKNFAYVEKRDGFASIDPAWLATIKFYLLPLRHYEWGANMNNCKISDEGYGTAITQATLFATMDRLGMAQALSRIGLLIDGSTGDSLAEAKQVWLDDPRWQGMRRTVEDSFVLEDWFELLVAQDLAMDGIVFPLTYFAFDKAGEAKRAASLSLLSEFFADWYAETGRWVDSVMKVCAAESEANRALIAGWYEQWRDRAVAGFQPVAEAVLGDNASAAIEGAKVALDRRAGFLAKGA